MTTSWLQELERRLAQGDEDDLSTTLVALAFYAGQAVSVPDDERRAAGRRALLLLAAGGDPSRGLDLDGRAVTALASELDAPERRSELLTGLGKLMREAAGLEHVDAAVRALVNDADIAWRAYAASLLADELDR